MAAGMFPLGGGTPNPRPNFRSFSTPGRYPDAILRGQLGAGATTPRTQTVQQLSDWNTAKENWDRIEAARKKRQEAYEAMAQKTGPTPKGVDVGQYKEAGDPFSPIQVAGGPPPSDVMARFGRPKKWPYLQSIVNMGQVT